MTEMNHSIRRQRRTPQRRAWMLVLVLVGVSTGLLLVLGAALQALTGNIRNEVADTAARRVADRSAGLFMADPLWAEKAPGGFKVEDLSAETQRRWADLRNGAINDYRIADKAGVVTDSSRSDGVGMSLPDDVMAQLRRGERIETKINILGGRPLPTGTATSYVPLYVNKEFVGVLGVFVNRAADTASIPSNLLDAYIIFTFLLALFALPSFTILWRYLVRVFTLQNELAELTDELSFGDDVAGIGHWSIAGPNKPVTWSVAAARMAGIVEGQVVASLDEFGLCFYQRDAAGIASGLRDLLAGNISEFQTETWGIGADDQRR
ncbi:MAG: hypothetical protein EXR11_05155, partial [Rhodospirillaceae bacterium]|nr:hypothetical protein [Rhodospirillaceae bacterium]